MLDKKKEELERTSRGVKDTGNSYFCFASTHATNLLAAADDSRLLDRLNPVTAPSYYEGRRCMQDMRQDILNQIVTWAGTPLENTPSNDSTVKNIFWLY